MKSKIILFITLLYGVFVFGQGFVCGTTVLNETFDVDGAMPNHWIEYNTSGRVTVKGGQLKIDYASYKSSVMTNFDPTNKNFSYSFDVKSTRNYTNSKMNLVSSTGKYIASFTFGLPKNRSVQYASDMSDGNPSEYKGNLIQAKFNANQKYSISMDANFTTKTINIYNEGVLMAEDIPFLENALDVAKIDIQINLMFSKEDRLFFDNIFLISSEDNIIDLRHAINAVETLINTAYVGDKCTMYSQSSIDAFQSVIDAAYLVMSDCAAKATEIEEALLNLETAKINFESEMINDPILKLYSGYNFSGMEYDIYCGYYNGDLDEYEDWAVSFKLEQGYMATFAEDINGLGYSKVYIAQDKNLEINLPADLQNSISFIRVSPWFPVGKKGSLGNVKWSTHDNYNTTWYYDWGLGLTNKSSEAQFVPMAWSTGDNWTSIEKMEEVGKNMFRNHIMAFNEPDNSGQSNLTVEQALNTYPKLLASGLRIGAPGVENVQYNVTKDSFNDVAWIQQFMDSCVVRGYRVDFIPAHDYVRRSKSNFIERFKGLHDRYNLPIWVTEYNYGNPNMGSENLPVEQGYTNIKGLTEALEEADFVERYNWYNFFGATSGIGGITDGELNITGQFYRNLESSGPSYTQEEHIQGNLDEN
jgi:hypothetical protein